MSASSELQGPRPWAIVAQGVVICFSMLVAGAYILTFAVLEAFVMIVVLGPLAAGAFVGCWTASIITMASVPATAASRDHRPTIAVIGTGAAALGGVIPPLVFGAALNAIAPLRVQATGLALVHGTVLASAFLLSGALFTLRARRAGAPAVLAASLWAVLVPGAAGAAFMSTAFLRPVA